MYLSTIANQYPVLTESEEFELAMDYKLNNNLEAAHKLVLHHAALAIKIVNRYVNYGLSREDLEQEAVIGLMNAVKTFDYTRGIRLASYAINYIRERVAAFVLKNYSIVNIGTTKEDRKLFFNRAVVNNSNTAAEDLNVTTKQLEHFEEKFAGHKSSVSLDDGTNILQLPSHFKGPEDSIQERDEQRQVEALKAAVAALDERTRVILESRHLTDNPVPLRELADRFGVSAARIEQIEKKAIKELKFLLCGV